MRFELVDNNTNYEVTYRIIGKGRGKNIIQAYANAWKSLLKHLASCMDVKVAEIQIDDPKFIGVETELERLGKNRYKATVSIPMTKKLSDEEIVELSKINLPFRIVDTAMN